MPTETVIHAGKQLIRWIPPSATKIEDPNGFGVGYIVLSDGPSRQKAIVMAFAGNASKHSFYESYRDEDRARARVAEFFRNLADHKNRVADRRAEASAGHSIKVGEIISNSWGYDQTNVDFYRVVKVSKNFVWLQKNPGKMVTGGEGPMSGRCKADFDGTPTGPIEMHRASGRNVTFKHGSGSVTTPTESHYVSWYA
jgi:hypothetical protein